MFSESGEAARTDAAWMTTKSNEFAQQAAEYSQKKPRVYFFPKTLEARERDTKIPILHCFGKLDLCEFPNYLYLSTTSICHPIGGSQ